MRFRRKPTTVEAQQFLGPLYDLPFRERAVCCLDGRRWYVTTIHDEEATIVDGDWIVLENPEDPSDPRAYPVKPDIFAATYEPVPDHEESPSHE